VSSTVIPAYALIGGLLGWGSWIVGWKLSVGAPSGPHRGRGARAFSFLILIMLGAGLLASLSFRARGDLAAILPVAALALPLMITLATDVQTHLIFPIVLVPGLLVALGIAATGPTGLLPALISGAVAGAVVSLLAVFSRRFWARSAETPLGSGDILLAATIGVILGPERTPAALFWGVVLAALAAVLLLAAGYKQRGDAIPYGAFFCLCALAALAI
jgi:prepilin signal peptidase PulO-like enzyme (type II secretory pathway)